MGENTFTITVTSQNKQFTQDYTVKITRKAAAATPSNTITVSFEFTGDVIHDGVAGAKHTVQTWIAKQNVTVPTGSTVKYITDMMLLNAGIDFQSTYGGTYIESVKIPAGFPDSGKWLGEFTNGAQSGWMYYYNGKLADEGYATRVMENGCTVKWFYTDDYTAIPSTEYENPDWSGTTPSNPSDEQPDDEKPADETPAEPEKVVVEVTPEVTVDKSGTATADVSEKVIDSAITEAAKDEDTAAIVIAPEVKGEADKVSVELPMAAVEKVADTDLDVTVKTDVAEITITNAGLADLAKEEGKTVAVSAETVKDEDGKATGEVKIEVAVGEKPIEKVSGGLTVAIPVAPAESKDEKEDLSHKVLVIVDEDGNEKVVKKSVTDGDTMAAVLDGSCTVKVVDNAKTFEDTNGHWASAGIGFASSHELFKGVSETQFAPDGKMDRGMLATVLFRLEDAAATGRAVFPDVKEGAWYTDGVTWASENKIVEGYTDGTFRASDPITREQMVTMLFRYAKAMGMDITVTGSTEKFTDAGSVSGYAADAMAWAIGKGLINGKTATTLAPKATTTRAEVAVLMERLIKLMVK